MVSQRLGCLQIVKLYSGDNNDNDNNENNDNDSNNSNNDKNQNKNTTAALDAGEA